MSILTSLLVFSPDLSQTAGDSGGSDGTVLGYNNLVFPFCILGAGIVASALLLIIEKAYRFFIHYLSRDSLSHIPPAAEYIKARRSHNLLE